jgi:hypothetical protein
MTESKLLSELLFRSLLVWVDFEMSLAVFAVDAVAVGATYESLYMTLTIVLQTI